MSNDQNGSTNTDELIYDWNARNKRGPLSPLRDRKITFFDETLRDGLQSPSVRDPSIEEKKAIMRLSASLGIDSMDLGLPGAGPRAVADVTALIEYGEEHKLGIEYGAAGRTHEKDITAIADIAHARGALVIAASLVQQPLQCANRPMFGHQPELRRVGPALAGCASDDVNPSVVATVPANGDRGVQAGHSELSVTFSEEMNDATVTTADFGNAGTAGVTILRCKHSFQDLFTHALDVLASPHGFDEMMIVVRRVCIQRLNPRFQRGKNLVRLPFT